MQLSILLARCSCTVVPRGPGAAVNTVGTTAVNTVGPDSCTVVPSRARCSCTVGPQDNSCQYCCPYRARCSCPGPTRGPGAAVNTVGQQLSILLSLEGQVQLSWPCRDNSIAAVNTVGQVQLSWPSRDNSIAAVNTGPLGPGAAVNTGPLGPTVLTAGPGCQQWPGYWSLEGQVQLHTGPGQQYCWPGAAVNTVGQLHLVPRGPVLARCSCTWP